MQSELEKIFCVFTIAGVLILLHPKILSSFNPIKYKFLAASVYSD